MIIERYEVLSSNDKVLGSVWWDTKEEEIASDNKSLLAYIKTRSTDDGITYHDGPEFLRNLSELLSNGYMYSRKADV